MAVAELAFNEARWMGDGKVGTEHLLIGVLRQGDSVAARVLDGQGVSLEKVRAKVSRLVKEGPPDETGPG
jgi:ATP-dependent Clp protease ATP-binding subunit ClpC